jgi:hypothetical protein
MKEGRKVSVREADLNWTRASWLTQVSTFLIVIPFEESVGFDDEGN